MFSQPVDSNQILRSWKESDIKSYPPASNNCNPSLGDSCISVSLYIKNLSGRMQEQWNLWNRQWTLNGLGQKQERILHSVQLKSTLHWMATASESGSWYGTQILKGHSIIVPQPMQEALLKKLHRVHQGLRKQSKEPEANGFGQESLSKLSNGVQLWLMLMPEHQEGFYFVCAHMRGTNWKKNSFQSNSSSLCQMFLKKENLFVKFWCDPSFHQLIWISHCSRDSDRNSKIILICFAHRGFGVTPCTNPMLPP